jgi:hypothetical protein
MAAKFAVARGRLDDPCYVSFRERRSITSRAVEPLASSRDSRRPGFQFGRARNRARCRGLIEKLEYAVLAGVSHFAEPCAGGREGASSPQPAFSLVLEVERSRACETSDVTNCAPGLR